MLLKRASSRALNSAPSSHKGLATRLLVLPIFAISSLSHISISESSPHVETTSRPPGLSTLFISDNAVGSDGKKKSPKPQNTKSKLQSGKAKSSASMHR